MAYQKNTIKRYTKKNINATVNAATLLFTTENDGKRFIITNIIIETTSISGFISVATLSIGTNASVYTNIVATTATASVINNNTNNGVITSSVAANSDVYVNITIPAVATTNLIRVDVIGYYE